MKMKIIKEFKNKKSIKFGYQEEPNASRKPKLLQFAVFQYAKSVGRLNNAPQNLDSEENIAKERQRCSGILYANIVRLK